MFVLLIQSQTPNLVCEHVFHSFLAAGVIFGDGQLIARMTHSPLFQEEKKREKEKEKEKERKKEPPLVLGTGNLHTYPAWLHWHGRLRGGWRLCHCVFNPCLRVTTAYTLLLLCSHNVAVGDGHS